MELLAEKIIQAALKTRPKNAEELNAIKRNFLRESKNKTSPTSADLLRVYHKLVKGGKLKAEPVLERVLVKRGVRTMSGVTVITVLTKPFPCPGQCIYCPLDERMPKSYLSDEPAAARALALRFDPHEQVKRRIEALEANGHPTEKIELIVKGGTWNVYPLDYQYAFILKCFEACNRKIQKKNGKAGLVTIKKELEIAQAKNELAKHRIVGLTLETRPDYISEKNILAMREQGCTRIELGVQTTDEKTLKQIKRGHDTKEVKRATKLLKNYGFKVDYHLMPQLPGATPAKDLKMLKEIFSDQDYRPDMIKIYPCTVIENSELFDWFKAGRYKTYSEKQLVKMLMAFKPTVPRYVRISRLIRDIPSHHVHAGNTVTNLRQVIQEEMKKQGLKCLCLRCREIGHQINDAKLKLEKIIPKLFVEKYEASGGKEYFLSFEDKKRTAVFAFCRLRLNTQSLPYPAFIRELHTYGQQLEISVKEKLASQHKGLGRKLVEEAEKICRKNKIQKLAVISGVGVRGYYRKWAYKKEGTYMVKKLV